MQVDLDAHIVALIRDKVASGRYHDPGEVVRDAVLQMDERDQRLRHLQAEVAIGLEQIERGELIDFTSELLDELDREAEVNARNGKPIKDAVKP